LQILEKNLDPEQLAIAARKDSSLLVLAPPGSGKTRLLTNAVAYRIRGTPGAPSRICCLTFGVEAAREMRLRLSVPALRARSDRYWVGNFHQFSSMLLARWGHLIGWPRDAGLLVPPESVDFMEGILSELGIHAVTPQNALAAMSKIKGRREPDDGIQAETLRRIVDSYQEKLSENSLRDFDDLIVHTIRLLREKPSVKRILHDTFSSVFVDELQDTSLLQLDLLEELVGESTKVFGVADDDQMIYSWRDARSQNIVEFQEKFNAELCQLVGTYRCPSRIVAVANAVVAANHQGQARPMESRRTDTHGAVFLDGANGEEAEAGLVAEYVRFEIDRGVKPAEIAILAPVKFLFDLVREALSGLEVPFVAVGFDDLLNAPAIRVLRGCLAALHGRGVLAREVRRACSLAGEDWISVEQASAAAVLLLGVHPRAFVDTAFEALSIGSSDAPTRDELALKHLVKMVRIAIGESDPPNVTELSRILLLEWQRLESAAWHAESAVTIMTSFLAKGLEYDIVVLPFLNDGRVPYAPRGRVVDWAEARRVFYVSITRSKQRVALIRDVSRPDSPLLDLLPEDICQPLPNLA
jgi:superfamily I DNA/RNA helicase